MHEVWSAVVRVVRAALERAGAVRIVGVGVTGQGDGAWLVDGAGEPLGPAVLWLDARAAPRVRSWQSDGRAALVRRHTGSAVFSGALPVLLDELAEREPERLARVRRQLNCKDWIRYRLTGVIATDASEASRTYLDVRTGSYSEELLAGLAHQRYRALLPPVLAAGEVAGTVLPGVAMSLALPEGVPVVTGLVDTAAAGAGLGCLYPGSTYAIVGTTAFVGTVRAALTLPDTVAAITLATGTNNHVIECLAPMAGTPNLDWARASLGGWGGGRAEAEREAIEANPGAGGVLYLPYAADGGERAPFVDANASAAWLGTTVRTTRGELLRAVYEGLAMSLRECMDMLNPSGPVRLCGGGATSALLCQILADVTGRTIDRSDIEEVGAHGVAALAATHAGLALEHWAAGSHSYLPDPALARFYAERFAAFVRVRDAIRPHWREFGRTAPPQPQHAASTA